MTTQGSEIKLEPLSFHRLKAYQACPFRHKYESFSKGVPAMIGEAVHLGIENYLKGKDAEKAIIDYVQEVGLSATDTKDALNLFASFKENKRYNFDLNKIITLESDDGEVMLHGDPAFRVPVPIKLYKDGETIQLALQGRMDMVYDRTDFIEIWDWKTGWLTPDEGQADFYAVAAYFKYWRPKKIVVRMALLRQGYATYNEYNEDDILENLHTIGIIAAGYLKEEKWEPRINEYCSQCSLKKNCEPYLKAVAIGVESGAAELLNGCEDPAKLDKWLEHLKAIQKIIDKEVEGTKNSLLGLVQKEPYFSQDRQKYIVAQQVRTIPKTDNIGIANDLEQEGIPAFVGAKYSLTQAKEQAENLGLDVKKIEKIFKEHSEDVFYTKIGYKKELKK